MNYQLNQFMQQQAMKTDNMMMIIQQQQEMLRQQMLITQARVVKKPLTKKVISTGGIKARRAEAKTAAQKKKIEAIAQAELAELAAASEAAGSSTGILGSLRAAFGGAPQPQRQQGELHSSDLPDPAALPRHMSSRSSTSSFGNLEDPNRPGMPPGTPMPPPQSPQLPELPPQPQPVFPEIPIDFLNVGDTKKSVWLTKCELQLNGQAVDQLESKQTKDQAINDFNRLFLTNGLANTLQSNYVSYPLFLGGCFVSAWDLSTSNVVGISNALPNIKTGW